MMPDFDAYWRTRRGSAWELVSRFRDSLTVETGDVRFNLECFDKDEAICVLELLTDAERKRAFATWLEFKPAPDEPRAAPPASPPSAR